MTDDYTPLAKATTIHGSKADGLRWLIDHGYRVPPGVVVQRADAAGLADWIVPGRRYAVRSSAWVEDAQEDSFAGQFVTVLDVDGPDAVRDAVEAVMASAHDERLEPYLRHAGIAPEEVRMSVIVQEMVAARDSGVAFSRNPTTGLADVVIEAVDGNGQDLVSGRATPERWVNHWGEWTQRPTASGLPIALMDGLASQVAAIADEQGRPVEVEWSWDGRESYLLQVRPVTVANVPVYSNRLAREFLPGIIPPLVWSVNVPVVNGAWLRLFTGLVGPMELGPEDLARQFAYRAYFNMGVVGDIFEAMSMPRDLLEVLMGLEGGDARPTFRPSIGVVRHVPRMAAMAWRLLRYDREIDQLIPSAERELARLSARTLRDLTDEELLAHMRQVSEVCGRLAFANIVAPLLFNAYGSVLRRRLARRGIDAQAIDFAAGADGLEAYDPKPWLGRLGQELDQVDETIRARVLSGDLESLPSGAAFLERFGHISDSGNDFSHVPWSEDPTRLAPLLSGDEAQVADPSADPPSLPADLSRLDRILAGRASRYRYERERVSYAYTRTYAQFRPAVLEMGRRLVERGRLDAASDIFYLTHQEVEAALDIGDGHDLRDLASRRQNEIELVTDVQMPETIFGDEFEPAPTVVPDRRLVGIPSSRGVRRAAARVVESAAEADRVESGDILVIPYSDVGWTPMLARAGAIVAESGGLLSHSSIVARELGIPCVVSVAGAMSIPDGATVRVDGFTGEVRWETAT